MRLALWFCCFAAMVVSGCGSGKIKPHGRLLKDGAPIVLKDDEESIQIYLDPVPAEGQKHAGVTYNADYNQADGTFTVLGNDRGGLPPGKYRIAVEHHRRKSDILKGAFGLEKTPFVRDVDGRSEINIDLAKPQS